MASLHKCGYLGEYPDRETAIAHVEAALAHDMEMVLHDWTLYQEMKVEQGKL
jgi:hypothetical protein